MPIDQSVSTGNQWETRYGYSRAVRSGNVILTTGTVSMNADGTPFTPDDAYEQAMRCFEIVGRAVEDLGGSVSDILRTRVFVTDIARSDEFGRAHHDFYKGHRPCLTMVEVARLIDPAFLLEIEAEALVAEPNGPRPE